LSSVGLEGRGAWMMFASPVGCRTFLGAKWIVSFVLSLVVALVLSLINAVAFSWSITTFLNAITALGGIAFALSGLGVGLSGLFPRFLFDNPAHRASVWAMLLGFVFSTLYLAFAGSAAVVAFIMMTHGFPTLPVVIGVWTFFVILTLFTGIVPVKIATQRLSQYQWEG